MVFVKFAVFQANSLSTLKEMKLQLELETDGKSIKYIGRYVCVCVCISGYLLVEIKRVKYEHINLFRTLKFLGKSRHSAA